MTNEMIKVQLNLKMYIHNEVNYSFFIKTSIKHKYDVVSCAVKHEQNEKRCTESKAFLWLSD